MPRRCTDAVIQSYSLAWFVEGENEITMSSPVLPPLSVAAVLLDRILAKAMTCYMDDGGGWLDVVRCGKWCRRRDPCQDQIIIVTSSNSNTTNLKT